MFHADLLSKTAELALMLVEKNGVVEPFCRAITSNGEIVIYTPEAHVDETNFANAEAHQRNVVMKEIEIRKLVGLAFCKVVFLTMKDPDEEASAIKVELHQSGVKSAVHYFTYRIEAGTAIVGENLV